MLFNTYTYAIFLPVVWLLYRALPLRGRQIMLLIASYVFYCWERPIYGTLLVISTVMDYYVAIAIEACKTQRARRWILAISVVGNLGMLGVFKYGDFFVSNVVGLGRLLGFDVPWSPLGLILPVGISFYTFQTMSYTLQVYRRQIPANRDMIAFAVYVSFFPQLVAGPIERATNLLRQLVTYQPVTLEDIQTGLTRIAFGLFRKMVLADRFAILVNMVFPDPGCYYTLTVWVALPAFVAQIYFDFSGYSDIAIGSARLFGIRLTENFHRPLLSSSIADFWNRWHMTLSSWLRDYLFVPLGGFRKGGRRALLNAWIVLLLCGLWHGARWNFVFWGGYQALMMTLYYSWRNIRKKIGVERRSKKNMSVGLLLSIAFTFVTQSFSALFFRGQSVANIKEVLRALVGRNAGAGLETQWYTWAFIALIAAFVVVEYFQEYYGLNERIKRWHWSLKALGMSLVVLAVILFSVNNAAPYIYFQF